MKTSTSEGKYGIQWTSRMKLDDLDFEDDLALLSHTSIVCGGNLENYESHHPEDTSVYWQLPTQNALDPLV
ncbi:unnamed protein product [Schistosoma margrebowiei]|uniref:Uncharacterized protein n=1 Tax=Schistosoma margrebowiei TaxID=48269 RepID=A0A183M749_9TREM|nr:unnamed protein product [Schistosoma margrebowiei]